MLDIARNRQLRKYPASIQLRRLLWAIVYPFFRLSPRPMFAYRRWLLRLFGARVGRAVHVYSSAVVCMPWNLQIGDWSALGEQVYLYNLGRVTIGTHTTISQRAHLCAGTHDDRDPRLPLLTPPITIGDQAWICADAFVGPGVTIGEGAVVGARAVVVRDVQPWDVVVGNPARVVRRRILRHDAAT